MICDHLITDLTFGGRNSTRCGYDRTLRKSYTRILQALIFPYTVNSNPGCSSTCWKKPREETEFGAASQTKIAQKQVLSPHTTARLICVLLQVRRTQSDIGKLIDKSLSMEMIKSCRSISIVSITHNFSSQNKSIFIDFIDFIDKRKTHMFW